MPFQPSNLHVTRPLTNVSILRLQQLSAFALQNAFPGINVSKQSDRYTVYDAGQWNTDEFRERGPGTVAKESGYSVDTTPTYFCREWALAKHIPDEDRANADEQMDLDREATLWLTQKAFIRREAQFIADWFKTGVWTGDRTGVASAENNTTSFRQFNDAASKPIEVIRQLKREFLVQSHGIEANSIGLTRPVFDALLDHPSIIGRINGGQTNGAARANIEVLKQLFDVQNIFVGNGIQNTAKEGVTSTPALLGGKAMLLFYRPDAPGLYTPSAGYTFNWTGLLKGANSGGIVIRRGREERPMYDWLDAMMAFDQRRTAQDLGIFVDTIVA